MGFLTPPRSRLGPARARRPGKRAEEKERGSRAAGARGRPRIWSGSSGHWQRRLRPGWRRDQARKGLGSPFLLLPPPVCSALVSQEVKGGGWEIPLLCLHGLLPSARISPDLNNISTSAVCVCVCVPGYFLLPSFLLFSFLFISLLIPSVGMGRFNEVVHY